MRRVPNPLSNPTTARALSTRSWSFGENPAAEATSRSTRLRISCNRAAWNDSATAPTCSCVGRPSSRQSPVVGTVNPAKIHASVDFPDPLPPWINNPSPWWTVKLTSRSAALAHGVPLSYSWLTPETSRIGGPDSCPTSGVVAGAAMVSTMLVLSPDSLRLIVLSAISASLL